MIDMYKAVDSTTADLYDYATSIVNKHFQGVSLSDTLEWDDLIQECMEGILIADKTFDADVGKASLSTWRYIKGLQRVHHLLRRMRGKPHIYPDQTLIADDGTSEWDYILPQCEGLPPLPDELREVLIERATALLNPDDCLFVLYHFGIFGERPMSLRALAGYNPSLNHMTVKRRLEKALQRLSEDFALKKLSQCLTT